MRRIFVLLLTGLLITFHAMAGNTSDENALKLDVPEMKPELVSVEANPFAYNNTFTGSFYINI